MLTSMESLQRIESIGEDTAMRQISFDDYIAVKMGISHPEQTSSDPQPNCLTDLVCEVASVPVA